MLTFFAYLSERMFVLLTQRLILVLSLAVISFVSSPWSFAKGHLKNYQDATVAIVVLENESGGSYKIYGSGFVFQWNQRVITCASVIDSIPSKYYLPDSRVGVLVAREEGNQFQSVSVSAIDREDDIALLESDAPLPIKPLQRKGGPLSLGKKVAITAFHKTRLIESFFNAYISRVFSGSRQSAAYGTLSPPIGQGAHGAPVFCPNTGALLGMVKVNTRLLHRRVHSIPSYKAEGLANGIVIPASLLIENLNALEQ